MSAMARELVEKAGVGESADAAWRDLGHEREKLLPRPPTVRAENDENPAFNLSGAGTADPAMEEAGIHLIEPPAGVRTKTKPSPWSTTTEHAVQLSLFG